MRLACVGLLPIFFLILTEPLQLQGPTTHFASIKGRVVTLKGVPIEGSTVLLHESGGLDSTVTTTRTGAFEFLGLTDGYYLLQASAPGFQTGQYGATNTSSLGLPIRADVRSQATEIVVPLSAGGAILGTVLHADGSPGTGVNVAALRKVIDMDGGVSYRQSSRQRADERGRFRLDDLASGEYLVGAVLSSSGSSSGLREVTTYFPGVLESDDATQTSVRNDAVELPVFSLNRASPAAIIGLLVDPTGRVPLSLEGMQLSRLEGRQAIPVPQSPEIDRTALEFRFSGLAPGTYLIAIHGAAGGNDVAYSASEVLPLAAGASVTATLPIQPSRILQGRVTYEGRNPPDLSRFFVQLLPVSDDSGSRAIAQSARCDSLGRFQFRDILPATYKIFLKAPPLRMDEIEQWQIERVNDRRFVDTPAIVDVRQLAAALDIAVTGRFGSVVGTVQDSSGEPFGDKAVVVYPSQNSLWTAGSIRVRATRPATDGRFVVRGLPEGDYNLALVDIPELNEWLLPQFLSRLSPSALVVVRDNVESDVALRVPGKVPAVAAGAWPPPLF